MKTQRLVGLAFCLAAALAVGQFAWRKNTGAAASGQAPGRPRARERQTGPAIHRRLQQGGCQGRGRVLDCPMAIHNEAGKQIKGRAGSRSSTTKCSRT